MRRIFYILLLFLLTCHSYSQSAIDSLENLLENASEDSAKVELLIELSRLYLSINLLQSVDYSTHAVEMARNSGNLAQESKALNQLGAFRFYQGNYEKALDSWMECAEVLEKRQALASDSVEKRSIADNRGLIFNNLGVVYKNIGEYEKAIEYYQENLKIQEQIGNTLNEARGKANIGNVYSYFEIDNEKALRYYLESLALFEQHITENKDKETEVIMGKGGMATTYLNIGLVYKNQNKLSQAVENYRKALLYYTELDDKPGIANTQNQMGLVYLTGGSYNEALSASLNALEVYHEIGQRKAEAEALKNIGTIYYEWGRYSEALDYFNQSLVISKELQLKKEVFDVYRDLSNVYKGMKDYREALNNYELYNIYKDSSIHEENLKQISELETKYETERVENENALLNAENLLQETEIKRQRIFLFSVIGFALLVLGGGYSIYRQYQEKKRANILLEEQNIEIRLQRDKIFQQKQEITDSIMYASRIQNAILPPDLMLSKLQDHFILYKPRDIVSGDYYWMTLKDNKTVVVAADCTGHGVPGAMMSMLGISFLNEIVNKSDQTEANEILNQLRDNVVNSLHQTGVEGEQQDGMDVALCVIDVKARKMQYAGAYNPLYLIRNNELIEYKADKMPIGIHREKSDPFINNYIDIEVGDCMYLFSDGYVDQFGGHRQKKFMSKRFKDLLLSVHKKPMSEQREILDNSLMDWMGDVEQIDDIIVMGLRI